MRGERRTVLFMIETMQHESRMSTVPQGPYSHEPTVVDLRDRGALILVNITLRPVGPGRGSFTYLRPAAQHGSTTRG